MTSLGKPPSTPHIRRGGVCGGFDRSIAAKSQIGYPLLTALPRGANACTNTENEKAFTVSPRKLISDRRIASAVILVILVAGVLGALAGKARTSKVYESTTIVMVIPPGAGNPDATMNPFVNLDSRIVQLALALNNAMSPSTITQLSGPVDPRVTSLAVETVKTSLASADAGSTAQLKLTAEATDPAVAEQYAGQLSQVAAQRLKDMQVSAGVRGATFASLVIVSPPTQGQMISASQTRAIVMTAMGAMALAAIVAAIVLAIVARILPRRRPLDDEDAPSEAHSDTEKRTAAQALAETQLDIVELDAHSTLADVQPRRDVTLRPDELSQDTAGRGVMLAEDDQRPSASDADENDTANEPDDTQATGTLRHRRTGSALLPEHATPSS